MAVFRDGSLFAFWFRLWIYSAFGVEEINDDVSGAGVGDVVLYNTVFVERWRMFLGYSWAVRVVQVESWSFPFFQDSHLQFSFWFWGMSQLFPLDWEHMSAFFMATEGGGDIPGIYFIFAIEMAWTVFVFCIFHWFQLTIEVDFSQFYLFRGLLLILTAIVIFFLERAVLQRRCLQPFLIILAIFLVDFRFTTMWFYFDLFANNWLLDFQIVLIIHVNYFIFDSFLDFRLGFYLGAIETLAIHRWGYLQTLTETHGRWSLIL